MPQLAELEGRKFVPFIEVKVEIQIASPEVTEEILRARIEEMKERAIKQETLFSPLMSEELNLGEMISNPYVYLRERKETKTKIIETKTTKEAFTQVLLQLMEEYGASPDRFKLIATPSLEDRKYPTNHEYLIFRSITLLNEDRDVKSIDWDIVCTRESFSL